MANLPSVPNSGTDKTVPESIEELKQSNRDAIDRAKKSIGGYYLYNLRNDIAVTNNLLKDMLSIEEARLAQERLNQGLLIEQQREASRKAKGEQEDGPGPIDKSNIGIPLGLLGALGLAGIVVALKTWGEDLATAIQGILTIKIGKRVADFVRALRTSILDKLDDLTKSVRQSKFGARLSQLFSGLKNLKFPKTSELLQDLTKGVKGLFAGLGARVSGFFKSSDSLKDVQSGLKSTTSSLKTFFTGFFGDIKTSVVTQLNNIKKSLKSADLFKDAQTAVQGLKGAIVTLSAGFVALKTSVSAITIPRIPEGGGVIGKFFSEVSSFFARAGGIFGEILKPVKVLGDFIGGVVFDTIGGFFKTTGTVIDGLFSFLKPVLAPIKSVLGIIGKFSIILTPFFALYDFITGFWRGYTESEGSLLSGLEEGLLEIFRGFFTKPLDLLKDYIIAPLVGIFSTEGEQSVKNFSITELFNSAYEGVKKFVLGLFGGESGSLDLSIPDFPNPLDIVGEKLFAMFKGVSDWIDSKTFLPGFLAKPFEWMANSVADLFDINKSTGLSIKPPEEVSAGNTPIGAGGTAAAEVASGTSAAAQGGGTISVVRGGDTVSAPTTNINNNSKQFVSSTPDRAVSSPVGQGGKAD